MNIRQNKNPLHLFRLYPKSTAAVLIVAGAIAGTVAIVGGNNPAKPASGSNNPSQIIKTDVSTPPPKKTSANATGNSTTNQGGANDQNGSGVVSTPTSAWTTSTSGVISLHSPTADSTLHSGDTISGTAKVSEVQFRLVDDQVGVIAQGSLSVVGGNFAGKISFKPHANTGQLDIFSYSGNGAEINSLSISLKLSL